MKKLNGILIFIAVLSIGLMAFVAYSLGIFGSTETAEKDKDDAQNAYKAEYEADSAKNREIIATIAENLFKYEDASEIYSYEFQRKVREKIDLLIEVGNYTEDDPLFILNPFGTNTQSLYTYFETETPCAVSYTVHTDATVSAAEDFGGYVTAATEIRYLSNGATIEVGNSCIHEFAINGLVPNETNIITIKLVDETGDVRIRRLYYAFGDAASEGEEKITVSAGRKVVTHSETGESKIVNASDITLTDGMFAVFSAANDYLPYVKLYDNDGFLRGEIPLEESFADSLYVNDGYIYLFVSDNKLVKINSLGEVVKIFKTSDYTFTGGWTVDEKGNILATATRNDRNSANDCIVIIDFTDDDIYMLVDFAKLLTESYIKRSDSDWIGITDVTYVGSNMIIAAANKFDSVIKVRRIYNDPRLVYIAGDNGVLQDTAYNGLYLKNENNFAFSTSAKVIGFEEYDKIRAARHYIWVLDENLNYEYDKKEEHFGYYIKYLADEEESSLRLSETVKLSCVTDASSLVKYNENWLYVSGTESAFYEYDKWFQLIASFTFKRAEENKTIEQQDYEEDNPPPDNSVIYRGISKFAANEYYFSKEAIIYKDETDETEILPDGTGSESIGD